MTEQAHVAPGWYSNGVVGQEQWWDGAGWSQHIRDVPAPPQSAAPRTLWQGRRDASLALGIVCVLLTFPSGFTALWALASGSMMFLVAGLACLSFALVAVWMFVNYYKVGRLQAAARMRQAPPTSTSASPN